MKKRVEILSRKTPTNALFVTDQESEGNVVEKSSHEQETGDTTPVSDLENVVSTMNSVALSTSTRISGISTVCDSPVVANNAIPTSLTISSPAYHTSLTVPLFQSASLLESAVSHTSNTVRLLQSAPSCSVSMSSISYLSVSYVPHLVLICRHSKH